MDRILSLPNYIYSSMKDRLGIADIKSETKTGRSRYIYPMVYC